MKKLSFPFIKQPGFMECGTTCLAMIFKYYGYYDIRSFLTERAEVTTEGIDLYTLSQLAEGFGFETDGYELEYENLLKLTLPCIAHYEGNHFVVVYKANADQVWIADPAIGKYKMTRKEFETKWNGVVLSMNPTPEIFKHNELTELVEERKKKQKNVFTQFYISSLTGSKKFLWEVIGATLILQVLGLALPFFTQAIVDQVLVNENVKLLYAILAGLVIVFVSQVVLTYGRNILLTQFKVTFERNFFSKYFDHFIQLKQSYFDNHKREDFINRFQENLRIRQAFSPSILEAVIDFAFVITYLLILFFYSKTMGFVALVFVLLYGFFTVVFTPRLKQMENQIYAENVKTMGQFMDTLLGIQSVRLLGIERMKFWRWKNQYTKALNKVLTTEKKYISLSTILKSLFLTSQAAIYWYGAFLTFQDKLTIGQYIAFITIFTIIINSLSRVTHLWFLFTELSVTFDRLNDVLIQEKVDNSIENKREVSGPLQIRFQNLNFKYRTQEEKYILRNINLDIEPGTFLGIVGRNGSGKSTLIKLLGNLYENYEGKILLNDTELQHIIGSQLRKKISIVPQETFLFDGTVMENIQYGNLDAGTEEIIEAARMADLHDFLKEQYLGYNLKVGENGVNLSGGERLKVALARLFVSDPEVIILDEASSSLDVETEKKIMGHIRERFKGKTIISIAHRLNTLRHADNIVVLDKGQIVEQGSHNELIKQDGLYNKFMNTYINF